MLELIKKAEELFDCEVGQAAAFTEIPQPGGGMVGVAYVTYAVAEDSKEEAVTKMGEMLDDLREAAGGKHPNLYWRLPVKFSYFPRHGKHVIRTRIGVLNDQLIPVSVEKHQKQEGQSLVD